MTVKQVLEFAKKNNTEIVDLRFTDLPGLWQHFSISMNEFDTGLFENGIGFDGSSIRGFPIPTSSPFTTTSSRGGFQTRPRLGLAAWMQWRGAGASTNPPLHRAMRTRAGLKPAPTFPVPAAP